ncbi:SDR family oxidoreductase [Burkholderia plantarii]|uniref:SDR family oxidoreductase n=1 Tax=Burkholderia plantarii TaxID=41899 RepID=UPI0018DB01D6|nr:SDR family oxidoreductase [Burkholderia plantarii]MBI0330233.1 SDR family oxidoreductase [Burkholderia plantarii]
MRIFLTGATGFIGSALVPELIAAGHQVLGMTRSDAGARALAEAGAEVYRGTLEDPESLRRGAEQADGVIHTAFDHDFSRFAENCEKDKRAIAALGAALAGSDRPLVITSGTGMGSGAPGTLASEDVFNGSHPNPRIASEQAGHALLEAGINLSVVRLPQVHDPRRQGLITPLVAIAREKGKVAYVGEGHNRWPAGHLSDAVRLYRLALEAAERGARYHAVGEEGVSSREIAEVLGRGLNLPAVSISPAEAAAHFGWMAMFVGLDMPASSALTQARLGWRPSGPTLISDLEQAKYEA